MAPGPYSTTNFRERYEHLEKTANTFETARNELVRELITEVERLDNEFQRERLDLTREAAWNRDGQLREERLKKEINRLREEVRLTKASSDRNPYVLILIDGNGMVFEDDFLKLGEQGGREAAKILHNVVQEYISYEVPDLVDYKIVSRIFTDLKTLAKDVCRSTVIDHPQTMIDFAHGFTCSKHLFDFIDVGASKDQVEEKMIELFKLNVYSSQCKQIIFGCSHGASYGKHLEGYTADGSVLDRVALLQGLPFEKDLARLQESFKSTKFAGLFRTAKLPVINPLVKLQSLPSSLIAPAITRSVSNHSNGSAASGAYAAAAALPPPPQSSSPPISSTQSSQQSIPRNRKGQRIDPPIQYDRTMVKVVRGLKLCNSHYLRGDCPYDPCSHDHYYKPSKSELNTLRYVARMAPCRHGSDCSDVKCIYGHSCPAGDPCAFGDNCRFPEDMHNMDTTVVKAIKI